jgi:hypothetical protein
LEIEKVRKLICPGWRSSLKAEDFLMEDTAKGASDVENEGKRVTSKRRTLNGHK